MCEWVVVTGYDMLVRSDCLVWRTAGVISTWAWGWRKASCGWTSVVRGNEFFRHGYVRAVKRVRAGTRHRPGPQEDSIPPQETSGRFAPQCIGAWLRSCAKDGGGWPSALDNILDCDAFVIIHIKLYICEPPFWVWDAVCVLCIMYYVLIYVLVCACVCALLYFDVLYVLCCVRVMY